MIGDRTSRHNSVAATDLILLYLIAIAGFFGFVAIENLPGGIKAFTGLRTSHFCTKFGSKGPEEQLR